MFANIKNRFISVIAPDMPPYPLPLEHHVFRGGMRTATSQQMRLSQQQQMQDKFVYARPPFLQLLSNDELRASADHNVRPIIVPRDINLLPWGTGYAECVNSGKSEWNEDQAAFCRQVLSDPTHRYPDLPYTYFGIFDGHAGYGAALAASHQFHHILHEKLVDCIDMLLPRDEDHMTAKSPDGFPHPSHFYRRVTKDELIVGALESAFFHMDALIAQDRDRYRDAGGCTACVTLFINGKMFVANAGDSRAVLCQRKAASILAENAAEITTESCVTTDATGGNGKPLGSYPVPFSFDHTPETERHRLLTVAHLQPELMDKQYVAMEYARRPHVKDLGQRILCRQGTMKGWTYKTLTPEDLRMPVVTGEGKRSRLLGTLGVTRGFGDHDLLAINTGIQIKPFLTAHPDVNYRDLSKIVSIPDEHNEDGDYGILIMATDGLWDVSENEGVARTVFQTLSKYPTERHRYTMVAQELVARARGKINDSGHWRLADSKAAATVDDISVIVIPIYQYYKEHIEWENKSLRDFYKHWLKDTQSATEAKEVDAAQMNGMGNAQAEVEVEEEDEDEEEVVVDLNKQTTQAQIAIPDDALTLASIVSTEPKTNTTGTDNNTAAKANDDNLAQKNAELTTNTDNVADKSHLTTLMTALEAAEITSDVQNVAVDDDDDASPETTPEKTNKSKQQQQQQQQQRNRNRNNKR